MKSLSIDTHPHDPANDQELYDMLKEADGNTTPATSTGDDDGETTVGTNPDQYPDPEDTAKQDGTVDASWGQDFCETNDAQKNSTEAFAQFKQSREKMLADLFDGKEACDAVEQKTMAQHLSHAASGDFETSSVQLAAKAKGMPKVSSAPETLMERVRKACGRY
jgi:hypothetical protein